MSGQEKEEQLRILGFDISDLSDETHSLLTTLSQLQAKLGVNTNDPDKLKELYFSKKLENIEYFEAASKMKRDIQELECSLEKEEDDISFLEKFIEDVSSKKLVTDAQKENNRIETQKAIKDVMNKIVSLINNIFGINNF